LKAAIRHFLRPIRDLPCFSVCKQANFGPAGAAISNRGRLRYRSARCGTNSTGQGANIIALAGPGSSSALYAAHALAFDLRGLLDESVMTVFAGQLGPRGSRAMIDHVSGNVPVQPGGSNACLASSDATGDGVQ
jgi:hypothetical protein